MYSYEREVESLRRHYAGQPCAKISYANERAARKTANRIMRGYDKRKKIMVIRTYQCRLCSQWHISKSRALTQFLREGETNGTV